MDQLEVIDPLARILIIGPSKVGKSHWCMLAAEAGFKILYIDGDDSFSTLKKITPLAAPNLYYLNAQGILQYPRMNRVLDRLLHTPQNFWDDTDGKFYEPSMEQPEPNEDHRYWEIALSKLDSSWIVVVDSWTMLCWNILWEYSIDNSVDLGDWGTYSGKRGIYQAIGNKATEFVNLVTHIPSHVVVTAHPDEYVKYEKPEGETVGKIKEADLTIEFARQIPKSISKPHGHTLPKNFQTGVFWMEIDRQGRRMLDSRVHYNKEGGGIWDSLGTANDYSLANAIKEIGGKPPRPASDSPGLKVYLPGEYNTMMLERRNKIINAQDAKPTSLTELVNSGGAK